MGGGVKAGWDEVEEELVESVRQKGMKVQVYVVGTREMPEEEGLLGAHWIRWDAVQEDLMKSA
ncbi:MAG: hypothetical protein H8E96_01940 [Verrucomicrobiaceae bacterium]|nr:hypothetical protein [Verrucomicrobiaceae bacterium]